MKVQLNQVQNNCSDIMLSINEDDHDQGNVMSTECMIDLLEKSHDIIRNVLASLRVHES